MTAGCSKRHLESRAGSHMPSGIFFVCPHFRRNKLIQFVSGFSMNEQVIFIGACFLFLSLLPALYQLNIFGLFLIMTVSSPMAIFFPGFLKAIFNYYLSQERVPATVGSAHVEFKWNKGLEATMIANDFRIPNPVPFLICIHRCQREGRLPEKSPPA